MWRNRQWLPILAVILSISLSALTLPVPEEELDTSTKLLGSSVVTSVSVVMGKEDESALEDSSDTRKVTVAQELPASPVKLLKPDSFHYYTFNNDGGLVKRQMTAEEIRTIVAAGGGQIPTEMQEPQSAGDTPSGGMKAADVVQNVQNVLKEELKKPVAIHAGIPVIPGSDTHNWNNILSTILSGEAETTAPGILAVSKKPETPSETAAQEEAAVSTSESNEKTGNASLSIAEGSVKVPEKTNDVTKVQTEASTSELVKETTGEGNLNAIKEPGSDEVLVGVNLKPDNTESTPVPEEFENENEGEGEKPVTKIPEEPVLGSEPGEKPLVQVPEIIPVGKPEPEVKPVVAAEEESQKNVTVTEVELPTKIKHGPFHILKPEVVERPGPSTWKPEISTVQPIVEKNVSLSDTVVSEPEPTAVPVGSGESDTMSVVHETHSTSINIPESPENSAAKIPESPETPIVKTPETPIVKTPEEPENPIIKTPGQTETSIVKTPGEPGTPIVKTPGKPETPIVKTPGQPETPIVETTGLSETSIVKTEGESETPIVKTPGEPGTPIVETPGLSETSTVKTEGESETPVVKTEGESETPVVKTPGEPGTPIVETPGEPETPIVETSGEPGTPIVETPGEPETPIVTTPGLPETPIVKTPGEPETPIVKTPGQPETPVIETSGLAETPIIKTPGQPETPIVKTPGEPGNPIIKTPGQTETSIVKTPGEPETPIVKTPGKPETPIVKTPGQPETPIVETPGLSETSTVKTEGESETPVVKTPGEPGTPIVKTPGEPETPIVKTPGQPETPIIKTPGEPETPIIKTPQLSEIPAIKIPELLDTSGVKIPELSASSTLVSTDESGTKSPQESETTTQADDLQPGTPQGAPEPETVKEKVELVKTSVSVDLKKEKPESTLQIETSGSLPETPEATTTAPDSISKDSTESSEKPAPENSADPISGSTEKIAVKVEQSDQISTVTETAANLKPEIDSTSASEKPALQSSEQEKDAQKTDSQLPVLKTEDVAESTVPEKITEPSNNSTDDAAAVESTSIASVQPVVPKLPETKPEKVEVELTHTSQTGIVVPEKDEDAAGVQEVTVKPTNGEELPESTPENLGALSTDLAASVSSMISQVSDNASLLIPVSQEPETTVLPVKKVNDAISTETELKNPETPETGELTSGVTETIATKSEVEVTGVVKPEEKPENSVSVTEASESELASESSTAKTVEPEAIKTELIANPEKPIVTKEKPIEKDDSKSGVESIGTELKQSEVTVDKVEVMKPEIPEEETTNTAVPDSKIEESITNTKFVSNTAEIPEQSEAATGETGNTLPETPAPASGVEGTSVTSAVHIDVAESKPEDSSTEKAVESLNTSQVSEGNPEVTESPVVRIQSSDTVSTINHMIETAPVQNNTVSVEKLELPETSNVPASSIASSLIAGVASTPTQTENPEKPLESNIVPENDGVTPLNSQGIETATSIVGNIKVEPELINSTADLKPSDEEVKTETKVSDTKVVSEVKNENTETPLKNTETKVVTSPPGVTENPETTPLPSKINVSDAETAPPAQSEKEETTVIKDQKVEKVTVDSSVSESSSEDVKFSGAKIESPESSESPEPEEVKDSITDQKPAIETVPKTETVKKNETNVVEIATKIPDSEAAGTSNDSPVNQNDLPEKNKITEIKTAEEGPGTIAPSSVSVEDGNIDEVEEKKTEEKTEAESSESNESETAVKLPESTNFRIELPGTKNENNSDNGTKVSAELGTDSDSEPVTENLGTLSDSAIEEPDKIKKTEVQDVSVGEKNTTEDLEKKPSVSASEKPTEVTELSNAGVQSPEVLKSDSTVAANEKPAKPESTLNNPEVSVSSPGSPTSSEEGITVVNTNTEAVIKPETAVPSKEVQSSDKTAEVNSEKKPVQVSGTEVKSDVKSPLPSGSEPQKVHEVRIQVNDTAVLVTKRPVSQESQKPTVPTDQIVPETEDQSQVVSETPEKTVTIQEPAVQSPVKLPAETLTESDTNKAEDISQSSEPTKVVAPASVAIKKPSIAEQEPIAPQDTDAYAKLGEKTTEKTSVQTNEKTEQKWTLIPQPDEAAATKTHRPVKKPLVSNAAPNSVAADEMTDEPVLLDASQNAPGLDASSQNLSTDIADFVTLYNELSFTFWTATNKGLSSARSLSLSPFGMISLLAMLFLGARGRTSGQMNDVIKLDDVQTFNPHLILQNVTDSVNLARGQGIANAAFVRELYADKTKSGLLPFYKERAQQFYDGHVEEVYFATISDIVRRRTNLLIRRQTGGRIRDFVKGNTVPLRSPLSALSANVFQTDCSGASSQGRDGEMYFAVAPQEKLRRLVPVPATVWRTGVLAGYEPGLDATVVALGGIKNLVSTIFVFPGQQGHTAPGDSLELLEQRLLEGNSNLENWNKLLEVLIPRPGLEVQVPKYSHRSVVNATAALKRMGLDELFSNDADLKGINGGGNELHIADILQMNLFSTCGDEPITGGRHHVEVYPASPLRNARGDEDSDEETVTGGSKSTVAVDVDDEESGKATRTRRAASTETSRIKLDRPFLQFVRYNPLGFILHMGRFNPRLI